MPLCPFSPRFRPVRANLERLRHFSPVMSVLGEKRNMESQGCPIRTKKTGGERNYSGIAPKVFNIFLLVSSISSLVLSEIGSSSRVSST